MYVKTHEDVYQNIWTVNCKPIDHQMGQGVETHALEEVWLTEGPQQEPRSSKTPLWDHPLCAQHSEFSRKQACLPQPNPASLAFLKQNSP